MLPAFVTPNRRGGETRVSAEQQTEILERVIAEIERHIREDPLISQTEMAELSRKVTSYRANIPISSKILDILPNETIGTILGLLDDVYSIDMARLVCKRFERTAWPAFVKSFNRRIFHPTFESLSNLRAFAKHNNAAAFFTKLNISTIRNRLSEFQEDKPAAILRSMMWTLSPQGMPGSWPSGSSLEGDLAYLLSTGKNETEDKLHTVLRGAFQDLENLREICIVEGAHVSHARPRPPPSIRDEALLSAYIRGDIYNMHAHQFTLKLIHSAIAPECTGPAKYLSRLTTLKTEGRLSIGALPSYSCVRSKPSTLSTCPFPHPAQIRTLTLSLTDNLSMLDGPLENQLKSYLPNFLLTLPGLTVLNLQFPRLLPGPQRSVVSARVYGTTGFTALEQALHLPHLTTLHLANLGLSHIGTLLRFLQAHRATLRHLAFISLALNMYDWRGFIHSIGATLDLDTFSMEHDLTPAELDDVAAAWREIPLDLHFSWADYRNAAKLTRWVGVKGHERVFERLPGHTEV